VTGGDGGYVLRVPGPVIEIARTLQRAGFETWCVGGAVRDALLGEVHLDWDLATAATPQQVRRLFARTIPVGIEFGTVGVLDREHRMHEVTTFRRDVQTDGRHAVVEFGASLDEDLARRDFTINAIAYDPIDRRLRDPFDGRADLVRRVVRAVGDAEARMREDRLRALRAIRFASRFDFSIEEATWRAIVDSAPFLTRLSPERVKQELDKTMEQVVRPSRAFARWRESGACAAVVPVLAQVSDEALRTVDALPRPGLRGRPLRKLLRVAALFSDVSGRDAEQAMRALRSSNQDVATVAALVDRWARYGPALTRTIAAGAVPADAELRRIAAGVGRLRVAAFVRLAAARWQAAQVGTPALVRALHRRLLVIAFGEAIELADLAVDGDDLRRAGLPSGPTIGRMLHALLALVIEDPSLNTHDSLLRLAGERGDRAGEA
jgi:tRNA nucleotidyltransferase (CCA-adding enzyme)